jgi:hypothetical protein
MVHASQVEKVLRCECNASCVSIWRSSKTSVKLNIGRILLKKSLFAHLSDFIATSEYAFYNEKKSEQRKEI